MRTLFHITNRSDWQKANVEGSYSAESLKAEGFIHLSRPHQVIEVANHLFRGCGQLVLLHVSQDSIESEVKYEGVDEIKFPHIYGKINLNAIVGVHEFLEFNGQFRLPSAFNLVGTTVIRKGQIGDESEIASVHCHAWLQSYKGIIPDSFLETIPLAFRKRLLWWKDVVSEKQKLDVFVAESENDGIIGFCEAGPARDKDFEGMAEIGAFYSLNQFKNKGIGSALFNMTKEHLRFLGYKKVILWALKDNPTVEFYKRKGGRILNKEKSLELGKTLTEIAFEWDL